MLGVISYNNSPDKTTSMSTQGLSVEPNWQHWTILKSGTVYLLHDNFIANTFNWTYHTLTGIYTAWQDSIGHTKTQETDHVLQKRIRLFQWRKKKTTFFPLKNLLNGLHHWGNMRCLSVCISGDKCKCPIGQWNLCLIWNIFACVCKTKCSSLNYITRVLHLIYNTKLYCGWHLLLK